MKKIILFILVTGFIFVSCNAKGQGEQATKKKITKENNTNLKTESKMKTIHLTKAEFLTKVANFEANPNEWKYLGNKPAIIDFYADWCGPCKSIAPVLEELAAEYEGEIYIYKIDTEAEQELASAFGIRSIPSLLFVPMYEAPQMAQGAMPKSAFKEAIESVLLKKK